MDLEPIRVEIECPKKVKLYGNLVFDGLDPHAGGSSPFASTPNLSGQVSKKDSDRKTKFMIKPPNWGTFLFEVYAQTKVDVENVVVFNYLISCRPAAVVDDVKKKKGLFKR